MSDRSIQDRRLRQLASFPHRFICKIFRLVKMIHPLQFGRRHDFLVQTAMLIDLVYFAV